MSLFQVLRWAAWSFGEESLSFDYMCAHQHSLVVKKSVYFLFKKIQLKPLQSSGLVGSKMCIIFLHLRQKVTERTHVLKFIQLMNFDCFKFSKFKYEIRWTCLDLLHLLCIVVSWWEVKAICFTLLELTSIVCSLDTSSYFWTQTLGRKCISPFALVHVTVGVGVPTTMALKTANFPALKQQQWIC